MTVTTRLRRFAPWLTLSRRSRVRTLSVLVLVGTLAGCSRHADVRDDGPLTIGDPERPPPLPEQMPIVDSAGWLDASPACGERPIDDYCTGPIDFACAPLTMLRNYASHCVYESGCNGNGWIRVTLSDQGCMASLAMEEPNAEFAACMFPKLKIPRCPCSGQSLDIFLGLGHEGDAGAPCLKPRG